MTTSVCQGLPSCLESGLAETHDLRLKLTPPISNFPQSLRWAPSPPLFDFVPEQTTPCNAAAADTTTTNENDEMGGWASLLSLTRTCQNSTKNDETVYIHPLAKRSESMLSDKSLEMCTESLGSETGNDSSDEFPSLSEIFQARELSRATSTRKRYSSRGAGDQFPPPLPPISGSGRVHVKPHREDGRLVLRAVSVASSQTYFKAERENGRLRLHFTDSFASSRDSEGDDGSEVDTENADYDGEGEDMEGNSESVEGEIGIGGSKIPRPVSKCKEDESRKREMLNFEAFCVATS